MDACRGEHGSTTVPSDLLLRERATCMCLTVTGETDAPEATLRTLRLDDDVDWLQRTSDGRRQSKGSIRLVRGYQRERTSFA